MATAATIQELKFVFTSIRGFNSTVKKVCCLEGQKDKVVIANAMVLE